MSHPFFSHRQKIPCQHSKQSPYITLLFGLVDWLEYVLEFPLAESIIVRKLEFVRSFQKYIVRMVNNLAIPNDCNKNGLRKKNANTKNVSFLKLGIINNPRNFQLSLLALLSNRQPRTASEYGTYLQKSALPFCCFRICKQRPYDSSERYQINPE